MKKCMTLTLESGQLLTVKESENKAGYFELLVDDLKAPLNRKEAEILTNTLDNFLG
jgi:hypothetical protein